MNKVHDILHVCIDNRNANYSRIGWYHRTWRLT